MKIEAVRAAGAEAPAQRTLMLDAGSRPADLAAFQEVLRASTTPLAARPLAAGETASGRPLAALQAWSDQLEQHRESVRLSSEESVRARDAISVLRMSRNVADAGLASDLAAKVIGLTATRLDQLTKLS